MKKVLDLFKHYKNEKLKNIQLGEVLKKELLAEMSISAYKFSKNLKIPQTIISEIINGRRRISATTALRLYTYFNNSVKFWIGLQDGFEIEEAMLKASKYITTICLYE